MDIEQEVKNLRSEVDHLKFACAPANIYHQLQSVAENTSKVFEEDKDMKNSLQDMSVKINDISSEVDRIKSTKIEIDIFTNEEIREEWKKSGIPQKEIAGYFGVEIPTVCKWLTGSLNDDRKRYDLMTYLRMRGVA